MNEPWTKIEFERKLRDKGRFYHIHHPFHVAMNSGESTPEQIKGWVANRFYYQTTIPVKDAAILANCKERSVRREWVQRVLDHDGYDQEEGGIEAWLSLAEAVGLTRDEVLSEEHVLPGVRFACDAYINFVRASLNCLHLKYIRKDFKAGPSIIHGSMRRVTIISGKGCQRRAETFGMV